MTPRVTLLDKVTATPLIHYVMLRFSTDRHSNYSRHKNYYISDVSYILSPITPLLA